MYYFGIRSSTGALTGQCDDGQQWRWMRILRRALSPLLACGAAFAAGGCERAPDYSAIEVVPGDAPPRGECDWSPSSVRRAADTTVIGSDSAPCLVLAVKTELQLRPSSDASHPDPSWTSVVRDSRGNIYTAATTESARGVFLVWSSDGSFVRSVGRRGEGPGEILGRGLPRLFLAAADSIYVREGPRWLVFDSEARFARLFHTSDLYAHSDATHVLSDGSILVTGLQPGRSEQWFHLADAIGALGRSFGALTAEEEHLPDLGTEAHRKSAVGERTFWVTPPPGAPKGYLLEEWTVDGVLRRVIRRDAPWIRPADGEPAVPEPYPYFESIHVDSRGLLWISIVVKDPRWRPLRRGEDDDGMASELYDFRYEVIDPDAGVLVASGVIDEFPDESERNMPVVARFLPGTSLSYRPVPDSVGLQTIEFYDLHLAPNR
jgi:hypothetical protein